MAQHLTRIKSFQMKSQAESTRTMPENLKDLNAHLAVPETILGYFGVDAACGLTSGQAQQNIGKYGKNELVAKSSNPIFKILVSNTFNSMNFIIGIAAIVSVVVLDWIKFTVLFIVIVTNSSIGFFQGARKPWML